MIFQIISKRRQIAFRKIRISNIKRFWHKNRRNPLETARTIRQNKTSPLISDHISLQKWKFFALKIKIRQTARINVRKTFDMRRLKNLLAQNHTAKNPSLPLVFERRIIKSQVIMKNIIVVFDNFLLIYI